MTCSYLNFSKIFPSFWTFGQPYYKNESIHLNSWRHSRKKQIDSLETQVVFVDIFAWTWNIWVAVQKIHKNSQNGGLREELYSENDFEAVLVNFCCYDYGANASEAVQKISTTTLLELCQLIKTANFIATPMKKHI